MDTVLYKLSDQVEALLTEDKSGIAVFNRYNGDTSFIELRQTSDQDINTFLNSSFGIKVLSLILSLKPEQTEVEAQKLLAQRMLVNT